MGTKNDCNWCLWGVPDGMMSTAGLGWQVCNNENIEQMHLFIYLKKLRKKPRGLISFVMASGDVQLLNKILPGSLIDWRRRHTVVLLNKRRVWVVWCHGKPRFQVGGNSLQRHWLVGIEIL